MRAEQRKSKVEEIDEKVDNLQVEVAVLDTKMKIGFGIVIVLLASPKFGGPSAQDVVGALIGLHL